MILRQKKGSGSILMDSDQGKLFVGGISWETDEEKLKEHFSNYGDVSQAIVMRDKLTGRPRGFGFVIFSDPSVLERVLQEKHHIDTREVICFSLIALFLHFCWFPCLSCFALFAF